MEKNMLIEIYPNELLDILVEAGISEQEAKSLVYDILMRKVVSEQPVRTQVRQPIKRQEPVVKQTQQQYQDEEVEEDEDSYDRRPVTQIRRPVSSQNSQSMNFSKFGQEFSGLKK